MSSLTHGFELVREADIPELNTHARILRHVKSGARLLSLENDDENKVFGISFRTPPPDSTGLPHILEHAVLCGSRKFPVREPFVELAKGSLKTFLNAITFPDKTCYPVASQNVQDFYNLVDVYLDAALYPLITPYTLQQEGWHHELDNLDAPLNYKGVVFNEMKGAFSSPDGLLAEKSQMALYPDTPYGLNSGGDPEMIPNLTYAQFKAFHETYYHPSNSYLYFWGDDDPTERLRFVNEYLKDFDARPVDSALPLQPRFSEPRRVTYPYDAGDSLEGKKSYLTVNWMLPEAGDIHTVLSLDVLAHILVATPASPLRKALIDSGLGEDLAGTGFDEGMRQMWFSTGMKGVLTENVDKVEALILDTLARLARQGIDPETVAASLNTIEFRLRERNTGRFPRGLFTMLPVLSSWLYDGDPLALLAFEAPLAAIKAQVAGGAGYFERLIRQHLLDNTHRVTVILNPDTEEAARREADERARLDQARTAMSPADLQSILESTRELKRRQETPDSPEALATIPVLKLADLERQNKLIPIEDRGQGVLYHDIFTNGLLYLDLGLDLHALPQHLLPYAKLFGRALLEMGTTMQDYVRLSQRIGRSTGGIRPNVLTSAVREGGRSGSLAWLFLQGKAAVSQADELLNILRDVLLTPQFDNRERFRQIVLEEKARLETALVPVGHIVVNTRLRSRFDEAGWAAEQIGGLEHLFFLRQLAERVDQNWPTVLADLEAVRAALVNRTTMLGNVTVDAINWGKFQPSLMGFLSGFPAVSGNGGSWAHQAVTTPEGLTIPAQVNYVGKGAYLYGLGYKLHGSVFAINNYLNATWLWERVRVQGGAYGGFSQFDHRSGVWTFFSYRDPNLLSTLSNYDATGEYLRKLDISPAELAKAIIGAIGDMDAYLLPDAKGYTSMVRYLAGDTAESRQRLRDELLATTAADFNAFGEWLEQAKDIGQVVVLGSSDAIAAANEKSEMRFDVKKVL